jgi:hypothetical protein
MKAQMNDKKSLENKINELVNNSRNMIDQKIKLINNLLISIKEENENIINKCNYLFIIISFYSHEFL